MRSRRASSISPPSRDATGSTSGRTGSSRTTARRTAQARSPRSARSSPTTSPSIRPATSSSSARRSRSTRASARCSARAAEHLACRRSGVPSPCSRRCPSPRFAIGPEAPAGPPRRGSCPFCGRCRSRDCCCRSRSCRSSRARFWHDHFGKVTAAWAIALLVPFAATFGTARPHITSPTRSWGNTSRSSSSCSRSTRFRAASACAGRSSALRGSTRGSSRSAPRSRASWGRPAPRCCLSGRCSPRTKRGGTRCTRSSSSSCSSATSAARCRRSAIRRCSSAFSRAWTSSGSCATCSLPTALLAGALLAIYVASTSGSTGRTAGPQAAAPPPRFAIEGSFNLLLIAGVVGAVLMSGLWESGHRFRRAGRAPSRCEPVARRAAGRARTRLARADAEGDPRAQRLPLGADRRGREDLRRHLRHDHSR